MPLFFFFWNIFFKHAACVTSCNYHKIQCHCRSHLLQVFCAQHNHRKVYSRLNQLECLKKYYLLIKNNTLTLTQVFLIIHAFNYCICNYFSCNILKVQIKDRLGKRITWCLCMDNSTIYNNSLLYPCMSMDDWTLLGLGCYLDRHGHAAMIQHFLFQSLFLGRS